MPHVGFYDVHEVPVKFGDIRLNYDPGRWSLPLPVLLALVPEERERKGDVRISELVGDPRVAMLRRRHDYYTWPEDEMWRVVGTGFHNAIEKAHPRDAERELFADINGVRVGGRLDVQSDEHGITDWKVTATYKAKRIIAQGVAKAAPEWYNQACYYAALCDRNNIQVTRSRLCVIVRDWRRKEGDVPAPIVTVDVPLPSPAIRGAALENAVERWKRNLSLDDSVLEECSDLWGTQRNGLPTRCEGYCPVNIHCNQYSRATLLARRR